MYQPMRHHCYYQRNVDKYLIMTTVIYFDMVYGEFSITAVHHRCSLVNAVRGFIVLLHSVFIVTVWYVLVVYWLLH